VTYGIRSNKASFLIQLTTPRTGANIRICLFQTAVWCESSASQLTGLILHSSNKPGVSLASPTCPFLALVLNIQVPSTQSFSQQIWFSRPHYGFSILCCQQICHCFRSSCANCLVPNLSIVWSGFPKWRFLLSKLTFHRPLHVCFQVWRYSSLDFLLRMCLIFWRRVFERCCEQPPRGSEWEWTAMFRYEPSAWRYAWAIHLVSRLTTCSKSSVT